MFILLWAFNKHNIIKMEKVEKLDEFEIDDGVRELAEERLASRLISADAAQEYGNDDIIIADETILSPASPM